jgi:hypothetical protein
LPESGFRRWTWSFGNLATRAHVPPQCDYNALALPSDGRPKEGTMKVSPKYARLLTILIVVLVITFVLSAVTTLRFKGISGFTVTDWFVSWGIGFLVAFPTAACISPIAQRIVALVIEQESNKQ